MSIINYAQIAFFPMLIPAGISLFGKIKKGVKGIKAAKAILKKKKVKKLKTGEVVLQDETPVFKDLPNVTVRTAEEQRGEPNPNKKTIWDAATSFFESNTASKNNGEPLFDLSKSVKLPTFEVGVQKDTGKSLVTVLVVAGVALAALFAFKKKK